MQMDYSGKWPDANKHVSVVSPNELVSLLKWRDADGDAEFILAPTAGAYPRMNLAVSGDSWYLHFFTDEDVAGFHSLGEDTDATGETHMPAGVNIWVPDFALVTGAVAVEAAQEFMATNAMPTCLEWFEL